MAELLADRRLRRAKAALRTCYGFARRTLPAYRGRLGVGREPGRDPGHLLNGLSTRRISRVDRRCADVFLR
jgi:hypothetical protein